MKKSTPSWSAHPDIQQWFDSPLGSKLLELEQQQLNQNLTKIFGYYSVCLGQLQPLRIDVSPILNKIYASSRFDLNPYAQLVTDFSDLPFTDQSIDLIILPHVLEFSENPRELIEEVSRCLIGEGYLMILGFNKQSLFGFWHWLQGRSEKFPWSGNFYSLSEAEHWLNKTGFEICESHSFYFRPPFASKEALQKLKFLEVLGPLLWPSCGGCYSILARKKISCLTPIKFKKKSEAIIKDYVAAHRERV